MKQITDLHNNSYDFWNMQKYITKMFECIPNNQGKYYHIKLGLSSINNNRVLTNFEKNNFLFLSFWIVLTRFLAREYVNAQ